jgi:carbon-monoxide dehydrogenase large subunit
MTAELHTAAGAYPSLPIDASAFTFVGVTGIPGPWRFQNFSYQGHTLATNKCPFGPYRAPGLISQIAGEGIMEIIAQELGVDPVEVRRKNIIRSAD